MPLKPYPTWCCYDCGWEARKATLNEYPLKPMTGVSTYHVETCQVCGSEVSVTQPRDFGYPNFEGHEAP